MAFRFGDPGGRAYGTVGASNVNQLAWWPGASSGISGITLTVSGGRTTGTSLRITTNGNNPVYLSKVLDAQATWGIAFVVKLSALPTTAVVLFSLVDSSTMQCDLRVLSNGTVNITRGGTTLGTTATALSVGVWTHIEWKTLINNSTGTTDIRINSVSALSLTAQNTRTTANNSANQITVGTFSNTAPGVINVDFDDIIIWDGQLTDPQGNPDIHDFIGDCGLVWLLPTGVGTTTQFTPDSGSNYTRVNEATPDGDTSYVEDATVGHIDTYTLADLPGTVGSVKSVAVVSYARKTDFSSRGMKHELRTNSTNVAHTNEIALGNSYTYYMSTWGQNPTGTPANWTVADINALEIGRQVSS